jgi:hypothetical protein
MPFRGVNGSVDKEGQAAYHHATQELAAMAVRLARQENRCNPAYGDLAISFRIYNAGGDNLLDISSCQRVWGELTVRARRAKLHSL